MLMRSVQCFCALLKRYHIRHAKPISSSTTEWTLRELLWVLRVQQCTRATVSRKHYPQQPSIRVSPNLSLPAALLHSFLFLLLLFLLLPLPLLLPRSLGREGFCSSMCATRGQVEGPLKLLQLPQELPALLWQQVLSMLRDEHLNVHHHWVHITGACTEQILQFLRGGGRKRTTMTRWDIKL